MKNYVGIDLGTTNSAICSYNGEQIRVYKSIEQADVTPSAIYINKRGKYIGKRALESTLNDPENVAMGFKRFMGTDTPINIPNLGRTMSAEECSSEIIKYMFNYLPDNIKNDVEAGTIITVPAAFNQMQKEATLQAAQLAGIGKVTLMQEPVAAIMSVMKTRKEDGIFLIYDLGGGTFDVSIAESIGGHINLQSQGGLSMCGGRDFDRLLVEKIVYKWLLENFDLPKDFYNDKNYKDLVRKSIFATERAKIGLSENDKDVISLQENELQIKDNKGTEIYLDILISRDIYNNLISNQIDDTIRAVTETLDKAGLKSGDVTRIVFVGGPTCYKPLRDKVSSTLAISVNTDINPMTAVAEGASIFAETIDWSSSEHSHKNTHGSMQSQGAVNVKFDFIERTPTEKTKLVIHLLDKIENKFEFQIDCKETGWTSGRISLEENTTIEIILSKSGENNFEISLFDSFGKNATLNPNKITITKTAASIDSIPASHSVGIEVLEKIGGVAVLDYLVRDGDSLPKQGQMNFRAMNTLRAIDNDSLNFKIWEGDIDDPITDNRFVGVMKISGTDLDDDAIIYAGADIELSYKISDDGNIRLEITIPSISSSFNSQKNFYSRQEGQRDYTKMPEAIMLETKRLKVRIGTLITNINDSSLEKTNKTINEILLMDLNEIEPEKIKESEEKLFQVKKELATIRKKYLHEVQQLELNRNIDSFDELRNLASPDDISTFDNLVISAKQSIKHNSNDFELFMKKIKEKRLSVYWEQDIAYIKSFNYYSNKPFLFSDKIKFDILVKDGIKALRSNDMEELRVIVLSLWRILAPTLYEDDNESENTDTVNIIKG